MKTASLSNVETESVGDKCTLFTLQVEFPFAAHILSYFVCEDQGKACQSKDVGCHIPLRFAETVGNSIACRQKLSLRSSLAGNRSSLIDNSGIFSSLMVNYCTLPTSCVAELQPQNIEQSL